MPPKKRNPTDLDVRRALFDLHDFLADVEEQLGIAEHPDREALDEQCGKVIELAERLAPPPAFDRHRRMAWVWRVAFEARENGAVEIDPAGLPAPYRDPALVARIAGAVGMERDDCIDELAEIVQAAEGSAVPADGKSLESLVRRHFKREPRILGARELTPGELERVREDADRASRDAAVARQRRRAWLWRSRRR